MIERHPSLRVAPTTSRLADARPRRGWVGRVSAARLRRAAARSRWRRSPASCRRSSPPRRGARRAPLAAVPADGRPTRCSSCAARGSTSARCAARTRLQVGRSRRRPTLALVESVGEPRFTLDVNWDPDTIPAFLALPACEAHGRSLPLDPYLVEPLEHYLRTLRGRRRAQRRATRWSACGSSTTARSRTSAARAPTTRRRSRSSPSSAASCARSSAPASPTCWTPGARSSPTSRGSARRSQALAALEADDAYPAVVVCPASLKLNWQRETRHWLPHRSLTVVSGTGTVAAAADITVINYDIIARAPRPARAAPAAGARARRVALRQEPARQADAGGPPARRGAPAGRAAARAHRHAGDEPRRGADRRSCAILGRLEDFGSGARFARRFQGIGAEERIHWHLRRRCFVRRSKADVLPQLPAKRQVVVPGRARQRARVPAGRGGRRRLAARAAARPARARRARSPPRCAPSASPSSTRCAGSPRAARLGAALAWIDDFLASDEPLVVFAGHREVQERLVERFPDALHILGARLDRARARPRCSASRPDEPQLIVARDPGRGPGHHAHARVQRRLPRPRVDARRCTTRPRTAATGSASTTP